MKLLISDTFAIIKPDAVRSGAMGPIITLASEAGLEPVQLRLVQPPVHWWRLFYAEHRDRPFFDKLVNFMSYGPSLCMVLRKRGGDSEDAIRTWREVMGSTDPTKAEPGTIRALYGSEMPANAVHGSSDNQSRATEIYLFELLLGNQR